MNGGGTRRRVRGAAGAALAAALLAGGCATFREAGGWARLGLRKHKPFLIVQTDAAAGWGVLTHPYLCRLSPRRIALTYNMVGDVTTGSGEARADWPAYSDDGGITWRFGDPFLWLGGVPSANIQARKGERFAFDYGYFFGQVQVSNVCRLLQLRVTNRPGDVDYHTSTAIFSADGETWNGPEPVAYRIPRDALMGLAAISPLGYAGASGEYACVAYGISDPVHRKASVLLLTSADGGHTFDLASVVAGPGDAPWGWEGADEPAVARLPDGELLCLMRTGSPTGSRGGKAWKAFAADLLEARSRDGGRTWSRRRLWGKPGVMPKLIQMSNGVLVCAFGRPGNNLMFSLDGGRSWVREMQVTHPDLRTSGYVDALEVAPGRLLVVYDAWDSPPAAAWLWEAPQPVCAVWGMFVDVRRR